MTHFSPISALVGGMLIGAGSAALLLGLRRIAGVSGIVGGLLTQPTSPDERWRGAFLVGLPVGATLVHHLHAPLLFDTQANAPLLVSAGLLVGFGTRLGSGCTSGHGVCGLSRGSARSVVATGVFMVTAAATVFFTRHLLGSAA